MVELLKIALANPANAIIIVLCLATTSLGTGMITMRVAMAVIEEKQTVNETYQAKFTKMNDTLIRIDQNLIYVKASIAKSN